MTTTVYLGLERGTHRPIREPIGHLTMFGQTRRAGKTTSLRELVRAACQTSGAQALIFRTGTAEISFDGDASTPFFREHLTWQSVESMLWTFLNERPKVYRPIIMKAVRAARTLDEVHRNIVAEGKKSKMGWVVDRTYELDTYFQEILPWLRKHRLATTVELGHRESVVDLEGWPRTVQQLVIAATLEALMDAGKRSDPLILVLPEARSFIPSDSKTPVTRAADRMAREGAKLNLFLWIDSQALTGVDQQILRNFALQLQGVQTSDLELSRVSKAFEVPVKQVRDLKVGDFILHTDDGVRTVHVPLPKHEEPRQSHKKEEESKVDEKERKHYEDRITELEGHVTELVEQGTRERMRADREHDRAEANAKVAAAETVKRIRSAPTPAAILKEHNRERGADSTREALKAYGVDPVLADLAPDAPRERVDLHVHLNATQDVPCLVVREKVYDIDAREEGENVNRLALLISEGFFEHVSTGPITKKFKERGWGDRSGTASKKALMAELRQLTEWGFLTELNRMWSVNPEAAKRIRVVRQRATPGTGD